MGYEISDLMASTARFSIDSSQSMFLKEHNFLSCQLNRAILPSFLTEQQGDRDSVKKDGR